MEIFGFVISVWAAVVIGLFFIAMVVGCTFDRRYQESPKWWILILAIVLATLWQWDNVSLMGIWNVVFTAAIWLPVLYYVLIGLAYSMLEFTLEVRRSARRYRASWATYKKERQSQRDWMTSNRDSTRQINALQGLVDKARGIEPEPELADVSPTMEKIAHDFVKSQKLGPYSHLQIIGIDTTEGGEIEPKVNRVRLAEAIGCWTMFWPFYLVSLIIGDLVTEVFNIAADFLASVSGRFVRMSFKDVFKF